MGKATDKLVQDARSLVGGMARGATTDLLGAPVDIVAQTMRSLGVNVGDTPVLGSKYLRKLTNQPTEEDAIGTIGTMLNPATAVLKGAALGGVFLKATKEQYSIANSLKSAGKTDQEIYKQTGIFPSANGQALRTELPDNAARLTYDADVSLLRGTGIQATSPSIIQHQTAYDHPIVGKNLKEATVRLKTDESLQKSSDIEGATYLPQPGQKYQIEISKGLSARHDDVMPIALHEMQHVIQDTQGMAGGANPTRILQQLNAGKLIGQQARAAEALKQQNIYTPEEIAHLIYWGMAGEVEARAVQARYGMSFKELKETMPTYDVPANKVIIRGN